MAPTKAQQIAPEVARLQREGMSRNKIAKELDCGAATVSAAAKIAGVTFDREQIRPAAEARAIDVKTRMLDMQTSLLDKVDSAMQSMNFENAKDAQALSVSVGIMIDKVRAIRTQFPERDDSMDEGRTALRELIGAIKDSALQRREDSDEPGDANEPTNFFD